MRRIDITRRIGELKISSNEEILQEFIQSGVTFAASPAKLENVFYDALQQLLDCLAPSFTGKPVLHEGGVYLGTWLESTGTISAEILSRFVPSAAQSTFELFAENLRQDGLMPYKVTPQGPVYRQIQMVTPLARSVWNHYQLNGRDSFLSKMYRAMSRFDDWLMKYRNSRGTGCVEAFCTFDTGHDLSPRFWHAPDTPHMGDPAKCHPDSPILPFLAPDLTANVYCQRKYFQLIGEVLGESNTDWLSKSEASLQSLMNYCYDEADAFFYDRDKSGRLVRVQSDVLLRVLACEVGDPDFFKSSLERYLLNTGKFFAKYPFTSMAMDDPRFDPSSTYNTWGGATNFLSLIRAPHAFEYHHRYVELTWVMMPMITAMSRMSRFAQTVSPWTGSEGYTEKYSPAILCLFDFIERMCGILPTPEGELWFTGLVPYPMDHGEEIAEQTAYSRMVDGIVYELVNDCTESRIYRDGELWYGFPHGTRLVTDREGQVRSLIGMTVRTLQGRVKIGNQEYDVMVEGNARYKWADGEFQCTTKPDVVLPSYG